MSAPLNLKQSIKTFLFIFSISLLLACKNKAQNLKGPKVFIENKNGKFTLYKNGKPFFIKGASGYTHLKTLYNAGGNTIRTWDTTNLKSILDSAAFNHLSVVVGLPMPGSEYTDFFYNDSAKVKAQLMAFKGIIHKYKNHPALLMWCIGNELNFPFNYLHYKNFYNAFNGIEQSIRQQDPDHPVTTTVFNFQKKMILNIQIRCNIDIISFNVFNSIFSFRSDVKKFSWFWKGPYLLTEWGIDGPWEGTDHTLWGAHFEPTSTKKAEVYARRYLQDLPFNDSRFFGSFVFYWGNKQESTATWFSLFDRNGAKSESVEVMQYLWTKTRPSSSAPKINGMLVNKKEAKDNLIYSAKEKVSAEVLLQEPNNNITRVEWEIIQEDWFKKDNNSNTTYFVPEQGSIINSLNLKASFIMPDREGPYRIFATLYDKYGNFATCNTPIYVLSK